MKKTIFKMFAMLFIAGNIINGCTSPAKKLENTEEKVLDTKKEV